MRISDWSSDVCSSDLINRIKAELSRRRMPAHLRGLFTGNAANNLIDPWLARSRQEIMGKIKSLDKGEFLGHVENVVERCLSGVTLHPVRSAEHTSELQSLLRTSYAVFCLNKNTTTHQHP